MPTRKQRRREQKSKRHEYEFVYVDDEGNELDEVPEELVERKPEREERRNGSPATAKNAARSSGTSQRRPLRQPPQPSWNRALKRGGLLGLVVFALFSLTAKGHLASVLPLALLYTALFVPFTYYIDRFAYRRWEARQQASGGAPAKSQTPAKKR